MARYRKAIAITAPAWLCDAIITTSTESNLYWRRDRNLPTDEQKILLLISCCWCGKIFVFVVADKRKQPNNPFQHLFVFSYQHNRYIRWRRLYKYWFQTHGFHSSCPEDENDVLTKTTFFISTWTWQLYLNTVKCYNDNHSCFSKILLPIHLSHWVFTGVSSLEISRGTTFLGENTLFASCYHVFFCEHLLSIFFPFLRFSLL